MRMLLVVEYEAAKDGFGELRGALSEAGEQLKAALPTGHSEVREFFVAIEDSADRIMAVLGR
jgi:hypothetical protein